MCHYFFLFDLLLEVSAEILEKNFVGFLEDMKTQKEHFQLTFKRVEIDSVDLRLFRTKEFCFAEGTKRRERIF